MPPRRPQHVVVLRRTGGDDAAGFPDAVVDRIARAGLTRATVELAAAPGADGPSVDAARRSPPAVDALVTTDAGGGLDALAAAFGRAPRLVGAYETEPVEHWDDTGGEPPGLVLVVFAVALRGLSRRDFRRRYLAHAAVARKHHPAIRRYEQGFVADTLEGSRPCDAIVRLEFASAEDHAERFYRDSTSREVVAADVAGFLDRAATWSVLSQERLLVTRERD